MPSVNDLFTRLNPLLVALLRSPLHFLVSGGLALLTVTGRRSGRRHTFPVGYQREGSKVILLASEAHKKQWWRNYRTPAPATLLIRGKELTGTGVVLEPGGEEFIRHVERTFRRVPGLARSWGVAFDARTGLTEEQVDYLRSAGAAVEIQLDAN
ncbi:MAG: nitroreductase/quinone reductase family protein [Myxococcota bacterium]